MTENKINKEAHSDFASYLKDKRETDKGKRRTGERENILNEICSFKCHFDIIMLQKRLNEARFHVSRATLYNTLNVLIDAGVIVRHHFDAGIMAHHPHSPSIPVMYELRRRAEGHIHFICTQCHSIREMKNPPFLKDNAGALKSKFTPEYFSSYVYGTCNRCKNKALRESRKNKV
ncbi:MAG: transcriptional repressor [Tannerellaceae bacterium]|jgi:Fur family ferric uptake transcriptional regulator|nr:transcriptional repressor [Tannerellaceae bacterium]